MSTEADSVIPELTQFEHGWIRGWLFARGIIGEPSADEVRRSLWALYGDQEAITPEESPVRPN
jgi:hypothetical protein